MTLGAVDASFPQCVRTPQRRIQGSRVLSERNLSIGSRMGYRSPRLSMALKSNAPFIDDRVSGCCLDSRPKKLTKIIKLSYILDSLEESFDVLQSNHMIGNFVNVCLVKNFQEHRTKTLSWQRPINWQTVLENLLNPHLHSARSASVEEQGSNHFKNGFTA